ncbi:MAG: reverse transcriptase domain-containing protein, partial [Prochlorothrix sp.]
MLEAAQQRLHLSRDPIYRKDRTSRSRPQLFPISIHAAITSGTWQGQQVPVPKNYKEAMRSSFSDKWQAAIVEHLDGHEELHTFEEVIVPQGTRVLPCQWVFDTKVNPEGEVIRFKARSVLLGNLQRPGIDFQKVFAPTIRPE